MSIADKVFAVLLGIFVVLMIIDIAQAWIGVE